MNKYEFNQFKIELRKERKKQILICNFVLSLSTLVFLASGLYFL